MRFGLSAIAILSLATTFGCSDDTSTGTLGFPGAGAPGSSGSAGAAVVAGAGGASTAGSAGSAAQAGFSQGGSMPQGGNVGTSGSGGAAAGSGGMAGTAGAGGLSSDPGTAAYQLHCFMCHGEQGVGTQLAPEIQHPVRDYTTWVVRTGLPGKGFLKPMEAVPQNMLSDADLNLIWDYLDKPPQPTTGETLYHDYCANCHGADGKGGPTTRDLTGDHDPVTEMVRKGAHAGMYDERNEFMPAFTTMRISDSEVQLIAAYVDTL